VREVGDPDVVFVARIGGEEEVWVLHLDILGLFPLPPSSPVRFDAKEIHDTLHSFSVQVEVERNTA